MNASLALWLRAWRAMREYHRYEVHGLDVLLQGEPYLIVGYHGRSMAYDICILSVMLYEELGYLPHGIVHSALHKVPLLKEFFRGIETLTADGPEIEEAIDRGEHILVTPGGTREGFRGLSPRYRVDWGQRTGYLRLALRHGLKIVPVGASGVDDGFVGINDGYKLGKSLGLPSDVPAWLGLGMTGPWPISLPFPAKIRQHIGSPVDLVAEGFDDPDDEDAVQAAHELVMNAVQALVDDARTGRASD